MEGRSKYSDRLHLRFLDRFKGKLTSVDKNGHIGIASATTKPIEKATKKYSEIYQSATIEPYAVTGVFSVPNS